MQRIQKGIVLMKCLEIKKGKGYFLNQEGTMKELQDMKRDDLLYLLSVATSEDESFEMDDMGSHPIDNEAHRIIYDNLYRKFKELLGNKTKFRDESMELYKDAINKYCNE